MPSCQNNPWRCTDDPLKCTDGCDQRSKCILFESKARDAGPMSNKWSNTYTVKTERATVHTLRMEREAVKIERDNLRKYV